MRILAALVVRASSLLGGERALTAGNSVDSTRAGGGVAAISGYVVDDVSYELDGAAITSVFFQLARDRSHPGIRLAQGAPGTPASSWTTTPSASPPASPLRPPPHSSSSPATRV